MKILQNKKGVSTIDALMAIVLLSLLSIIFTTNYSYSTKSDTVSKELFATNIAISNKLEEIRLSEWSSLQDEQMLINISNDRKALVDIKYSDEGITSHNTKLLKVEFTPTNIKEFNNNFNHTIYLEKAIL